MYIILPEIEQRQTYGMKPKIDLEMYKYALSLK